MKKLKEYSKWVAAFIFAVAVITVYKTYDNLSNIKDVIVTVLSAFKPFFIAFIIAYVLNLPAVRIKRVIDNLKFKNVDFLKKHSHGISIAVVYVVAVGLLTWAIYSLVPRMYMSLVDLVAAIPQYINTLIQMLANDDAIDNTVLEKALESALKGVDKFAGSIDLSQFGKYAVGVMNITSGVFSGVIALIASVYMLLDKENIKSGMIQFLAIFMRSEKKLQFVSHARDVNDIFTNYIYSRLICCAIMAVASTIILSILRVEYALILGLFIGAMDMIPYFGSIISTVIAILVAFVTGGPVTGFTSAIVLLILQQIDGNILGPKVMGETLEIRPLWIIIAVTVGGSLFGFMGMLISVPVVAVLRILFLELVKMYEEQKVKNDE